jgi:hypothetical protein
MHDYCFFYEGHSFLTVSSCAHYAAYLFLDTDYCKIDCSRFSCDLFPCLIALSFSIFQYLYKSLPVFPSLYSNQGQVFGIMSGCYLVEVFELQKLYPDDIFFFVNFSIKVFDAIPLDFDFSDPAWGLRQIVFSFVVYELRVRCHSV